MTAPPIPLPSPSLRHGSRSTMTCAYRCGDACDRDAGNRTHHLTFDAVVGHALTRRRLLQLGGAGVAAGVVGTMIPTSAAAAEPSDAAGTRNAAGARLRFKAVPPNTFDTVTVPRRYRWSVVVGWGDPVEVGAPAFDPYDQTPAAQAMQLGYNNDFLALLPLDDGGPVGRGVLVANHEYTDEELMFPGYTGTPTVLQMQVAMAATGLSVVVLERHPHRGEWSLPSAPDPINRRITVSTPTTLAGPAAGHPLVQTAADPAGATVLGTLNNCAGGVTPWGTTLHGEENFDNFFDANAAVDPEQVIAYARYGLSVVPETRRGWSAVDPRFDLAAEPNEPNRFGWVVELDPYDRQAPPVKRTMLGRFKHEGATCRLTKNGRVAVYMGDDERFEYLYKFVSRGAAAPGTGPEARALNSQLLDRGTLYVARFTGDSPAEEIDGSGQLPSDGEFDGVGEWIRLTSDTTSYVPGMSVAEVLVHTRLAADLVAPTRMDRPEDVEPSPVTGRVYVACTNNRQRTVADVDETNPRPTNRHGHVVEITERKGDAGATTFAWRLVLVCGDPADPTTYFAGYDKTKVSPISCPDNLAFDADGNLWIGSNGNALGTHDGLFVTPLAGRYRGEVKQLLTVPVGAEVTGPVLTDDRKSVLLSVQHPGETTGSTFENPSSDFPDGPGNPPRPAVVVVWHKDDEPIGSA